MDLIDPRAARRQSQTSLNASRTETGSLSAALPRLSSLTVSGPEEDFPAHRNARHAGAPVLQEVDAVSASSSMSGKRLAPSPIAFRHRDSMSGDERPTPVTASGAVPGRGKSYLAPAVRREEVSARGKDIGDHAGDLEPSGEDRMATFSKIASYQDRIDKNQSSDVRFMRLFTVVALVTSAALLTGLFIFAKLTIQDQNIPNLTPSSADGNWVYGLVQIASLRIPAARAGFYAMLPLGDLFDPSITAANPLTTQVWQEVSANMNLLSSNLFSFKNPASVQFAFGETTATLTRYTYTPSTGTLSTDTSVSNLLDQVAAFRSASSTIAQCYADWLSTGTKPTTVAACYEAAHFINGNSREAFLPTIRTVMGVYEREVTSSADQTELTVIILTSVIGGLLVIVVGVVAIPVFRRLVKEREGVLKLFRLIPKSTVHAIVKSVSSKASGSRRKDPADEDGASSATTTASSSSFADSSGALV